MYLLKRQIIQTCLGMNESYVVALIGKNLKQQQYIERKSYSLQ